MKNLFSIPESKIILHSFTNYEEACLFALEKGISVLNILRRDYFLGMSYDSDRCILCEWEGSRYGYVKVSWELTDDNLFSIYWPLKEVKNEFMYCCYWCIRTDNYLWWLVYLRIKLSDYKYLKCWVIYRLVKLGLAYTPEGCIRSWSDIGKRKERIK